MSLSWLDSGVPVVAQRTTQAQPAAGNPTAASGSLAAVPRWAATAATREPDEVARSRTPAGILASNVEVKLSAGWLDVVDFAVNGADLPPGVTSHPDWQRAMSMIAGDPLARVSVSGFTDSAGSDAENLSLRQARGQTVIAAMPEAARNKVLFQGNAVTDTFLDTNATIAGRAHNRGVRITFASTGPTGQDPVALVPQAKTFDEYLFLVRQLEIRLGLTGPQDARTALSVLRQVYYGSAAWSSNRNPVWDSVITTRPWPAAKDPTSALQPALMAALKRSNVVEGTDVGHILTGIEAMLAPGDVAYHHVRFNLANEEWATWAGDVGSAAAEWALAASWNNTSLDALFQQYASSPDLVGDIDSYAIRAGLTGAAPASQLLRPITVSGTLSAMLRDYLRVPASTVGQARDRRIHDFVQAYGGIVVGSSLRNRDALVARLRPSVDEFARVYFPYRLFTSGQPVSPASAAALPQLLDFAIIEMTERFVDWLAARL